MSNRNRNTAVAQSIETEVETVDQVVETTETVEQVEQPKVVHDIHKLMSDLKTKSAVIRHLSGLGLKTSDIVKVFKDGDVKMIYQHVRNVLHTQVKKG